MWTNLNNTVRSQTNGYPGEDSIMNGQEQSRELVLRCWDYFYTCYCVMIRGVCFLFEKSYWAVQLHFTSIKN